MATSPRHAYEVGDTAALRITAHAGGVPLDDVEITWEAGNDRMPANLRGNAIFHHGVAELPFGTMAEPGFRWCQLHYIYEGKSKKEEVTVAFEPERIKPFTKMPPDFRQYWQRHIKRQLQLPMDVKLTPCPQFSDDSVEVSVVSFQCGHKGRYIYGFLSVPRDTLSHPALLVPPGAGINKPTPSNNLSRQGFITLELEIHGISPLLSKEDRSTQQKVVGDYWYTGIEDRDTYYYNDVFLACYRAMDYLLTVSRVDKSRVGTYGGSQGGALSIVTAALHPAVKFLVAYSPAMCDMTGFRYGRAGGWPRLFMPSRMNEQHFDADKACATVAYYDVVNFARILCVPGFYHLGYNDPTCPPTSMQSAINVVEAPKTVCVTPRSYHWRYPEVTTKAVAWINHLF